MDIKLLGGLLKRVGNYDPNKVKRDFNQRLILQKTIYILQKGFGIDLGYHFSLYIKGPYSPSLAKDGYELIGNYERLPRLRFTDPKYEQKFTQFLAFLEPMKNDETKLELCADLLYFYNNTTQDSEELFELVKRRNFKFDEKLYEEMFNYLKEFHLLN